MVEEKSVITDFQETPPRISEWNRFWKVFLQRKIVIFGLVILVVLVLVAVFAELLAPYDPVKGHLLDSLKPPGAESTLKPGFHYWLGTDNLGMDTLSRLIFGTRTALLVGFVTTAVSALTGILLGLLAGYLGGFVGALIMRVMDALMGFPMLLLALFVAAILGAGIQNVMIALGVAMLPGYARVMNGLTLSLKENDYILAEKAMGATSTRTMIRHILPNALAPMIVLMTMQLGNLILAEAALSFLGIGIKPPTPAWGAMASNGYRYLGSYPMLSFSPSIAIMLVAFAFQLVGDGLRDALDPRLRGLL
jgi:peptide/nickel transport system permease protein